MIERINKILEKYNLELSEHMLFEEDNFMDGWVVYNGERVCRIYVYTDNPEILIDRVRGFSVANNDNVFIGLNKLMKCLQENKVF